MRHPILLDSDVQAALWRDRRESEVSVNDILRRRLGVAGQGSGERIAPIVHVERSGVCFVEGFEIFRIYKGTEYRAQAVEAGWLLLQTGEVYPSLNKLSRGIGTGIENAWNYWRYCDKSGHRQYLAKLRQSSAIEGL